MSRRRRNRGPHAAPSSPAPESTSRLQAFNLSGFEAANPSQRRGWLPWTTLDSSRMLSGHDRRVILRSANWAYANIGLARRIVNGLANLVGYLTPQAATSDKPWNTLVEETYRNRAGFPGIFDRAGKLNDRTWQIANTRARLKDGDLLTVLSSSASGAFAQVIVYEAPQIDNGQTSDPPPNLRDGVFLDKFGRHTAYRIVDPSDPTKWATVPAEDAIFFADFERPGQVRGISALAHALIHLQDRAEVWGDVKHAIKVAAQVGLQKVREKMTAFPGQHFSQTPDAIDTGVTDAAGDPILQNTEKIMGSGYVHTHGAGEKFELLHDDRPHPNQREFLEDLVRDIAWGVGVAPEVLWQLAGQTGPNTRYLMAELQRWIAQEQMRLQSICQRFWVYFVAKEMIAGRLPFPKDEQWWKCDWVPQADLTIDRGREGKLQLEQLRYGATTFDEVWKSNGGDFESAMDRQLDRLDTLREKAKSRNFELADLLPGFFNKPAAAPAPAEEDDDVDEPEPEPKKKRGL